MEAFPLIPAEVARAVEAYDATWSDKDAEVWERSQAVRPFLLNGAASSELEDFVWYTIKTWGKVQGVVRNTRAVAARVLCEMEWRQEHFQEHLPTGVDDLAFAVSRVSGLVDGMNARGIKRKEYSAASKILHWLMPWRIPIYDSIVRSMLHVTDRTPPTETYRRIVRWQLDAVRELVASGKTWVGSVEPRSELRALDKYLWWEGGGLNSRATGARLGSRLVEQGRRR